MYIHVYTYSIPSILYVWLLITCDFIFFKVNIQVQMSVLVGLETRLITVLSEKYFSNYINEKI